jgi:hypothetical protein
MAGYLEWLPKQEDQRADFEHLREKAREGTSHGRTPAQIAELFIGFRAWTRFAVDVGAIESTAAEKLRKDAWIALVGEGIEQAIAQHELGQEYT